MVLSEIKGKYEKLNCKQKGAVMNKLKIFLTLILVVSSSLNVSSQKEKEVNPPIDGTEETEELAA